MTDVYGDDMLRRFSLLFLLTAATLASTARAEEGFVSLFDGETLQGWTTASGKPVTRGWIVEDGAIVRESRGGSIYSEHEYGDFELRFEWKLSRRGNSGVKYRVAFYPHGVFGGPEHLGYEYQLWDDANRSTPPHMSAGSIYGLAAPDEDKPLRSTSEYNSSSVVVQGTKIEHGLNGKTILKVDTATPEWQERLANSKFANVEGVFHNKTGRIQLQDHGNRVWFRNIRIKEFASSEAGGR